MSRYLNNALASSMLPDGSMDISTLTEREAASWLMEADYTHVGNPRHGNTWNAVARILEIPSVSEAEGGRLSLKTGDELLVAQVTGLPRETREFTDEEIAAAIITFRLVRIG